MRNTIEINLKNFEEITEKYNNNKLSEELARYIFSQCMAIPVNQNPEINIRTNFELTEEQKNNIVDMMHRYFGLEVQKSIIVATYKRNYQILLFLIGLFLITLSNLGFILKLSTIHELFLIFGWVAVWELIYDGLFTNYKENIKRKRYKKLSNVKVIFIK